MFFRFTPGVTYILAINIFVFIVLNQLFRDNVLFNMLAMHYTGSEYFMPHQFFTYMFLHANGTHIFSNMLGIFIFGPLLEDAWGKYRFLVYYLICGLGAGMIYAGFQFYEFYGMESARDTFLEQPTPSNLADYFYEYDRYQYSENIDFIERYREQPENPQYINAARQWVKQSYISKVNIPMVGASGALYGILIAFGLLFPNTEIMLFPLFIPIKAKFIVAFYGIMAYFGAVMQTPGDSVAHVAHLSGMLIGFIVVKFWQKNRNRFY